MTTCSDEPSPTPEAPGRAGLTEPLTCFLEGVRRLASASAASLLVDPGPHSVLSPVLLHTEEHAAIARFASPEGAAELISAIANSAGFEPLRNDYVHYCRLAAGEHLVGIALQVLNGEPIDICGSGRLRPRIARFPHGRLWIALALGNELPSPSWLAACGLTGDGKPPTHGLSDWLFDELAMAAAMAWRLYEFSVLPHDPVTNLPGRGALATHVDRLLHSSRSDVALALVNPDDFQSVNDRFGNRVGDRILREIGQRLLAATDWPGALYRYGGAVFAAVLHTPDTLQAAEILRELLVGNGFALTVPGDAVRFGCSVGVVRLDAIDVQPLDSADVLQCADSALHAAKVKGGNRVEIWTAGTPQRSGRRDRLAGIYTEDARKDYRNMSLLLDVMQAVSARGDSESISNEFVDRVCSTFKPNRAALIYLDRSGKPDVIARCHGFDGVAGVVRELSRPQIELLLRAQRERQAEHMRLQDERTGAVLNVYAVPLNGSNTEIGSLYIDGNEGAFRLDSSDLVFLTVLATQVAVVIDRSNLESRWKREQEYKSRRLREELRGLRDAFRDSKVVFRSEEMRTLLESLHKMSASDATVLITGESGTGKEVVARLVHQLSSRREAALVIVDCSAIAPSLMEAELFGYERGAYTGAHQASPGRIAQAHGSTLFLDEIGEIPLDLQAKLLRFVQEKEIAPIGGTKTRRIDVRIVAATNRNLAAEVAAGRFRQDLYYRLQVLSVEIPPLRERPDDILPLAYFFLEKFSIQCKQTSYRLAPEACDALLQYHWPGNVRELENRVLQAVIMSDDETITQSDLRISMPLDGLGKLPRSEPFDAMIDDTPSAAPDEPVFSFAGEDLARNVGPLGSSAHWERLRDALSRCVAVAIERGEIRLQLNAWLMDELVRAAYAASDEVSRRASTAIGMPETTFRRRLQQIKQGADLVPDSQPWAAIEEAVAAVVRAELGEGNNLAKAMRSVLVAVVVAAVTDDAAGASLLGVTIQTYRRWRT